MANITGMTLGYLGVSSTNAAIIGNYIPGPRDRDPKFGGDGTLYRNDPLTAWRRKKKK